MRGCLGGRSTSPLANTKEQSVRTILLAGLLGIAFIRPSFADVLKSEELQPFSERVMAKIAKGDLDGAFREMKRYLVIPDAEYETLVANTRAQRGLPGTRFGKVVGYECVEKKAVGQSLVKINCLEKTEKHALPWRFYFYKAPSGWVLNSFNWSDNLPSIFNGAVL